LTLKDKIYAGIHFDIYINESNCIDGIQDSANRIELIADENAIAFTDWCEDYYYPSSTKGIWFDKPDFDNAKQFLTIELLQIYKKEKQL
jgi:hypothetical protein